MNRGLWIARKNYLCVLIKKLSYAYGGDTPDFLRLHCQQVIDTHPAELIEDAIVCYQALVEHVTAYPSNRLGFIHGE